MQLSERNNVLKDIQNARGSVFMIIGEHEYREEALKKLAEVYELVREGTKECVHQLPKKFKPYSEHCTIFDADKWVGEGMRGCAFIPSDGSGLWGNDEGCSKEHYDVFGERPKWATKVAWYNK